MADSALLKQEGVRIKVEAFEPYLGWTALPEEVHTLLLRAQRAPQSLSKRDLLEITPEQLTLLLKVLISETDVSSSTSKRLVLTSHSSTAT